MNQRTMNNKTQTKSENYQNEESSLKDISSEKVRVPSRESPDTKLNREIHGEKTKYTSIDEIPLVLTVEDLEVILNIGRTTAYELVGSNQIKSFYVGRQIRINKSDLLAYMGEQAS